MLCFGCLNPRFDRRDLGETAKTVGGPILFSRKSCRLFAYSWFFLGSPSEMRYLGEQLASLGWTVLGIRLSGHGTTPEQMAKTRWEDVG